MAFILSCVIVLILDIVEANKIQTATVTPQDRSDEDEPSRRFTDFDSYQYQSLVGSPISEVFKTLLLEQGTSNKHNYYDEDIDYQDNGNEILLFDDIISDILLLESVVYDNPFDNLLTDNLYSESSYLDSLLLDSSLTIKKPWKKLLKKTVMKRPKMQKSLDSYQRRQLIKELKQLLKMLLPLVRESGLPMRARMQVGRRRGDHEKQ